MARLNEPSAPLESVEALKRRFVRQNREIARVNSTQSVKIRNLEGEVSHLLSENILLREQIIKLQFQIDNNLASESIGSVKQSLEAKLVELGSLIQELGNVQQDAEGRRALRRKSGVKSAAKQSPDQRNWKNGLTISEVMGGADGRLPPIVEGKYYPRRTLDADDALNLAQNSEDIVDSPELGPPPVAHFEAGDPIKFDSGRDEFPAEAGAERKEMLDPTLLVNLETRRKRRESSRREEDAQADSLQMEARNSSETDGQARWEHTLKSGAKRKFSARESNGDLDPASAPTKSDFEYHRSRQTPRYDATENERLASKQTTDRIVRVQPEPRARTADVLRENQKASIKPMPNGRSILAPSELMKYNEMHARSLTILAESVNTDPVSSPVKASGPVEAEEIKPAKKEVPYKSRDRNRTKEQAPSQRFTRPPKAHQTDSSAPTSAVQEVSRPTQLAPRAPAPSLEDLLAPEGSAPPPPARPEGRDTPPPGDLDPEAANTNAFGSMGRASRRQRGSISYVEPNLRDKMRRPTKDLVDAVGAEERLRQRRAGQSDSDRQEPGFTITGEGASNVGTVMVKQEQGEGGGLDWKTLPVKERQSDRDREMDNAPSPLGAKSTTAKTVLPDSVVTERRRRHSILDRERVTAEARPQGSGAASTIAALNPKPRSHGDDKQPEASGRASRLAETASSVKDQESSPAEVENLAASARTGNPSAVRASRRHSSVADGRVKDALSRRAERSKQKSNDGKTEVVPELKHMRSAASLAVASEEGAMGRGERAASRRRSMML
ncbi:MAG: hypothetical protein Q9212_000692 [Teloschistes hypoglaucus]